MLATRQTLGFAGLGVGFRDWPHIRQISAEKLLHLAARRLLLDMNTVPDTSFRAESWLGLNSDSALACVPNNFERLPALRAE